MFLLGLNISLWNISEPANPYFDEVRYISAARQLHSGGINENWSHPPLGKVLIGLGIEHMGDNALGWRVMSSLFGALSIAVLYAWGLILFRNRNQAALAAFLALVNQVHLIESRIAMLDVFMFTFIAAGLCLFSWLWLRGNSFSRSKTRAIIFACGLIFGLGLACKWFTFVPLALCLVVYMCLQRGTVWERARLASMGLIIAPLATYLSVCLIFLGMSHPSYAPSLHSEAPSENRPTEVYSTADIIPLQLQMIKAQTAFENPRNPYISRWFVWPALLDGSWYDFRSRTVDDNEERSGIIFLGNPLVFWFGFLAVCVCAVLGLTRKSPEARLIAIIFTTLWLSWAIIPRKTLFSYYYYPAAMILSFALVEAARLLKIPRWVCGAYLALCVLCFYFFFPVLTDLYIPLAEFDRRLFLPIWRGF
ncbi:MAG: phospholipid carrier-dependent glycosyltransferase [Bdellovibrionales bacterium]